MLKKFARTLVLTLLFVSLFVASPLLPSTSSALAATAQQENTIILEVGSATSDDIKDLRYGQGKISKKISRVIESLKQDGQIEENAQTIIVVVKKKRSQDW